MDHNSTDTPAFMRSIGTELCRHIGPHQLTGAKWERSTMYQDGASVGYTSSRGRGRRKRPHPSSQQPPSLHQRHLAPVNWCNLAVLSWLTQLHGMLYTQDRWCVVRSGAQ